MKLDFSYFVTPVQERHPGPRSGTGVQLFQPGFRLPASLFKLCRDKSAFAQKL
ncbi:MAG: hypothetical protein K9J81_09390 [Desulfohalobiaceae bacterium]|nr:hypothetical protein [Desulfohalobiaceae bacterium]